MRVLFTLQNKDSAIRYSFLYANRFELEVTYMIFIIKFQIKITSQLKLAL